MANFTCLHVIVDGPRREWELSSQPSGVQLRQPPGHASGEPGEGSSISPPSPTRLHHRQVHDLRLPCRCSRCYGRISRLIRAWFAQIIHARDGRWSSEGKEHSTWSCPNVLGRQRGIIECASLQRRSTKEERADVMSPATWFCRRWIPRSSQASTSLPDWSEGSLGFTHTPSPSPAPTSEAGYISNQCLPRPHNLTSHHPKHQQHGRDLGEDHHRTRAARHGQGQRTRCC